MYMWIFKESFTTSLIVPEGGRWLLARERAVLHGVTFSSMKGLQTPRDLVVSLGNMLPVNLAVV